MQRAASTGGAVSRAIEGVVRESSMSHPNAPDELLTWDGGRPLPEVNLDDNEDLLDVLGGTRSRCDGEAADSLRR